MALAAAERPSLRDYQRTGISFLVERSSALLADEMGLGKTVQAVLAIQLLLRHHDVNRVLLVTPASLRLNWEREFRQWAPNLVVRRLEGSGKDRLAFYMLPIPVLIATYDQIRNDYMGMRPELPFDLVVADEAQRLKNPNAETTLACRVIPRTRTWALTGTPLENRVGDFSALWNFVKLGLVNRSMTRREMHAAIQPHFLRRTKAEVLSELPAIIEQDAVLELTFEQRLVYDDLWEQRRLALGASNGPSRISQLLELITRLKQICNREPTSGASSKLERLRLVVEHQCSSTDKIIVFSQYVETLQWLACELPIPNEVFFGDLTEGARDSMLERFRKLPGPRALLVSLRAGSVGLNLQEASTVILFDRWWNPAVEAQAIQRAHRFGRTRPLHVLKFVTTETIEERIVSLLEDKRLLYKEYVDGAPQAEPDPLSLYRILDLQPSDEGVSAAEPPKEKEIF